MPTLQVESADASMRAYYASRAPIYDEVYLRPERQDDLRCLRGCITHWFAGRTVLEAASGTGWWTQHIAPVAARVTATDALAEPLALARLRPGVGNVTFLQANAYALPSSLGAFDAAFAGLWISHVPVRRRHEFIACLHANLAPGARMVLVDNTEAQCERLPIVERDATGNTYQQRVLPDGTTHRVLKNFLTEAQLRSMIDGVGSAAHYWRGAHFWAFWYESTRSQRR